MLDKWTESIDKGHSSNVIYMDYQKAFDTVPHRRLVGKLVSHGIRGEVLSRVESFLNDRRQRVVVNGKSSEWTDVTSGIPQGSVLGPILFVIYINDMPDGLSSEFFLFADDNKIFREIKQKRDCDLLQKRCKCYAIVDRYMAPPFPSLEMSCHDYWSKENQPGVIQFTRWEGGGIALNQVNSEKDISVII